MTSATSAKEDEVTSSEEAKAFTENESNAEVKGQSLRANSKVKLSHYRLNQALGGSRKLRLSEMFDNPHMKVVRLSVLRTGPVRYSWYSFF